MSSLLKKESTLSWSLEHLAIFDAAKKNLASDSVLMIPDGSKLFHVVCDARNSAIGCALMQFDDKGRE